MIKKWRKIELLEFFLLQKKQAGFAWNFFETPIGNVERCLSPLFQRTHFLIFPFSKKLYTPPGYNQQNGKLLFTTLPLQG